MNIKMTAESTLDSGKRTGTKPQPGYIIDEHGKMVPDYEQTFIEFFEEGSVIKGTVIRIDRDEVLVDIGFKSDGVIPNKELAARGAAKASDVVNLGDEIEVFVLEKEDKEGRLVLSKRRADYEKAWRRITEIAQTEGSVTGHVIE